MTVTEPLYIDNSTLSAMARCSTEAFLRYWLGYTTPEERAPLRAGDAAHKARAAYYETGDVEAALSAFDDAYEDFGTNDVSPDDRLSHANTRTILEAFFQKNPVSRLPFRVYPSLVEVGAAYPLTGDDGIVLCGRLDALAEDRDDRGKWYVDELKTTGAINDQYLKQYRIGSQGTGYTWLAQRHYGDRNVVGMLLTAIEFSRLPWSSGKCTRGKEAHGVSYDECRPEHAKWVIVGPIQRTPAQLAEWERTALHLARRYRDLITRFPTLASLHRVRMQGMFCGLCARCEFYDFCAVDRPLKFVPSMLRYEPWSPFERVQPKLAQTT